jgi:hypothetical protein
MSIGGRADFGARLVQFTQRAPAVFGQRAAGVGQHHAVALALEQQGAALFFEHPDMARHRWLHQVQQFRSLGGAARFGNGDERADLLDVHGRSSSGRAINISDSSSACNTGL